MAAFVALLRAVNVGGAGVLVRTAAEMADVLARNPFPDAPPSRTMQFSCLYRRGPMCWRAGGTGPPRGSP